MFENYVIVERKRKLGGTLTAVILFVFMILFFYLGTVISPFIFELPALFCGIGGYLLLFKSGIEYEYSYFDGELKITKIKDKRRRKRLRTIAMDKVVIIAHAKSESVKRYEENKEVWKRDFSSGRYGENLYDLICSSEDGMECILFEPDEKMLSAMKTKYARIIVQ